MFVHIEIPKRTSIDEVLALMRLHSEEYPQHVRSCACKDPALAAIRNLIKKEGLEDEFMYAAGVMTRTLR
jgi:hypothetical protein